ncbi:MAG: DNA polymerase III subunit delta [Clostridiales bacterium]|jgi:DNA polymerase-3 subunit delta|nr:DNA polymerase III subunit delta [Clostridiales bacterium]
MKKGYREIFNDIKKKQFDRLYLFYGEEEYVKEQAMLQLTQAIVTRDMAALNHQVLDGDSVTADDIIYACETLPFMAEKRLVVVKDLPVLMGTRTSFDEDRLKAYLSRLPDTTCLVFYCMGKINKRKSLYNAIQKLGQVVEFQLLKQNEIAKWIVSNLKRRNKKISSAALQHFIDVAGNRLEKIYKELNKLVDYIGDNVYITEEDIDTVVTPSAEYTIFQLIETVGTRNVGQAMYFLDRLLSEGENIFSILVMISRHISTIFQCKCLSEKGLTADAISRAIDVHPYTIKKCLQQSRYFTASNLKTAMEECLKTDYGIKSGRIQARIGVEMLIMKMCNI